MVEDIIKKANEGVILTKQDALTFLKAENTSGDFYKILSFANGLSRKQYGNRGYIFAQIGINSAPCGGNCKFCSLARDSFAVDRQFEKDSGQVIAEAKAIDKKNIDALFLMTTADFDKEKFIEIGKAVRENLAPRTELVANVGDFDADYASRLKSAGFSGAYHVVRLREGTDTDIKKETRTATLDAVKSAGLELYYRQSA